MPTDTSSPSLPATLERLLEGLGDAASSSRLRRVYVAASRAIGRLSDMDLVQYEASGSEATPDLALWEEMAPVIRDTVIDVNQLLQAIREAFPEQPGGEQGLAGLLSRAVAEAEAEGAPGGGLPVATAVLHQAMGDIAQGITQLGEAMRSPQVVSDRWNLLAEIQRHRARFREQIGELVFASASALGEVRRPEVVPGYEADVKSAVVVRAVVADLARVMGARASKIEQASAEDVHWNTEQLRAELDAFGRTQAYRALRAQDKRRIVEARTDVGMLVENPACSKADVLAVVQGLDAFVRELAGVNQRALLVLHDREVWAACGVQLERAAAKLELEEAGAALGLAEGIAAAQALYGRDASLDAFLRKARRAPLAELSGPPLVETLERFQSLLASLAPPFER